MAITTTPLGFKKPDGAELVRGGDNVIADNAQKSEDLHANARGRLTYLEGSLLVGGTAILIEDPDDAGFYVTATVEG